MYSACKPLGIWFSTGTDIEAGSPLDRALLLVLLFLSVFLLSKRQFSWSSAFRENGYLAMLLAYMLISIIWSPMPFISLRRWTRELVAILMAFLVLSEQNPYQTVQSIFRRVAYVLIPTSLLLIKYYPDYGRAYDRWDGKLMWVGVTTQKNGLALVSFTCAFFLIWTLLRRRIRHESSGVGYQEVVEIFLIILALVLQGGPQHSMNYSATSNLCFALGLSCLAAFWLGKKRGLVPTARTLKIIISMIFLLGTVLPFLSKMPFGNISTSLGRDDSLTGRTGIWRTLVPYAMARPLLGYGAGGFWTTSMRELTSAHAHNGYLDMILNLGFVGLSLFLLFFMSLCKKAHQVIMMDFEWGIFFVSYLLMGLVSNMTESSVDSFTRYLSTIILFLSASSASIMSRRANSPSGLANDNPLSE